MVQHEAILSRDRLASYSFYLGSRLTTITCMTDSSMEEAVEDMQEESLDNTDLCLACGMLTVKGHRRVLANCNSILLTLSSIMRNGFDMHPSRVEDVIRKFKYVHRNCHNKLETFNNAYEELKSNVGKALVNIENDASEAGLDPTIAEPEFEAATGNQKRSRAHDGDGSASKKPKTPLFVQDNLCFAETSTISPQTTTVVS